MADDPRFPPSPAQPVPARAAVPAPVAALGDAAAWRYLEFFAARIRNPNTRRAYARACGRFLGWCGARGLALGDIRPLDVGAYVESLARTRSAPTTKQQLAAIRMLLGWLAAGGILPANPAAEVRGPRHVVRVGRTPALDAVEWRRLFDAIPAATPRDLRDRALIATLTYGFARVGAALALRVGDIEPRGASWVLRLREKGGRQHAVPCHHALAGALLAYIEGAGIAGDRGGFLFRAAKGRDGNALSERPMAQPDAWRMVRRRAAAAGIAAPIGCHSFRATGITAFLDGGGALERAQALAGHESPRTTKLYDRRAERLDQAEVERIRL